MAWGLRRPVESHDWRRSASVDELREYDAFGPWIYNVTAERDTPKRFRAACERHHDARFLLKAPRAIERRDAHPGMDLYIAMLAVHNHGASFMRLAGEDVTATGSSSGKTSPRSRVTPISCPPAGRCMLRDGGAISFDYNAVSSDLMERVTELRPRAFGRSQRSAACRRSGPGRHNRRPLFPLPAQRRVPQRAAAGRADPRRASRSPVP